MNILVRGETEWRNNRVLKKMDGNNAVFSFGKEEERLLTSQICFAEITNDGIQTTIE